MIGRLLLVSVQLRAQFSGGNLPQATGHVVADASNQLTVRRSDKLANPAAVGVFDLVYDLAVKLPPQQFAIVAAADQQVAGDGYSGDEAGVTRERKELGFFCERINVVNIAVRCTDEDAAAPRRAAQTEKDLLAGVLFQWFQLEIRGHGEVVSIIEYKMRVYARTSRTGLVPISVSGTGRLPTWYCFWWSSPIA